MFSINVGNRKKEMNLLSAQNKYERINFRKTFMNKGYVKKILCLYDNEASDVVYFNEREMTNVPCIDKDIFIISDCCNEDMNFHPINPIRSYTLVQIDFSTPCYYKVLMVKNSIESNDPKGDVYKYIRDNNLVEIKKESRNAKHPQIDFGYGNILVEILTNLRDKTKTVSIYSEKELNDLIYENRRYSPMYIEEEKHLSEYTSQIRLKNHVAHYLRMVYEDHQMDSLHLQSVLTCVKKFQTNYYYNL